MNLNPYQITENLHRQFVVFSSVILVVFFNETFLTETFILFKLIEFSCRVSICNKCSNVSPSMIVDITKCSL